VQDFLPDYTHVVSYSLCLARLRSLLLIFSLSPHFLFDSIIIVFLEFNFKVDYFPGLEGAHIFNPECKFLASDTVSLVHCLSLAVAPSDISWQRYFIFSLAVLLRLSCVVFVSFLRQMFTGFPWHGSFSFPCQLLGRLLFSNLVTLR
jgi:hypothetical protein